MIERGHNIRVEKKVRDLIRYDRARVQCGRISNFGLMELSRQRLKVTTDSDKSVKSLKGLDRPVNNYKLRSKNLMELKFVDAVIVFSEQTPINLIKYLLPDVLTKGGDYKARDIIGSRTVEKSGGKVVVLPYLKGYSTTSIINTKMKRLD